jgi:hypothetical protein
VVAESIFTTIGAGAIMTIPAGGSIVIFKILTVIGILTALGYIDTSCVVIMCSTAHLA